MTTVRDLIAHLERHFQPDDTIAAAIWQVDDVCYRAQKRGMFISDERAAEILERIDANHDACLGVTWETIDHWLDHFQQAGV